MHDHVTGCPGHVRRAAPFNTHILARQGGVQEGSGIVRRNRNRSLDVDAFS